MAILQITVTEGKFKTTNGLRIKGQSETKVVGNGWCAKILQDGTIECVSGSRYIDGKHVMRYVIYPNGIEKLTLLTPKGGIKVIRKEHVLERGEEKTNGLIGLSDGEIDKKFAYFRRQKLQEFMDKYHISAVRACTANGAFRLINRCTQTGYTFSDIYTDGMVKVIEKSERTNSIWHEEAKKEYYEQMEIVGITKASWTIAQQEQHEGGDNNCYCILYTKEAIENLKLPDIPASPNRELFIH